MKSGVIYLLLLVTVSCKIDLKLNQLGDVFSNLVEQPEFDEADDNFAYNEAADAEDNETEEEPKEEKEYEYSVPYDGTIKDFVGISSPNCGDEIEQLDVSKMKKPHQIRLSFTGICQPGHSK